MGQCGQQNSFRSIITTISTPVAASRARIFLPSLPIILPLFRHFNIETVTAFSIAVSGAILWIVLIIILLDSLLAVSLASSLLH
jgi:hypothetical protein